MQVNRSMRVYHFTKAHFGLEALRRRRLKVARIAELNDPFEFLQVASRSPRTRGQYQSLKRGLSEFMGLLCFSETWSDPVQWSHYAESHRGVCLGFDVSKTAELRKVRYVNERIAPNLGAMKIMGEPAIAHMLDLLTLKFEHWCYEREHRLFVHLEEKDDETGLHFFDFGDGGPLTLRTVIVSTQSEISPGAGNGGAWRSRPCRDGIRSNSHFVRSGSSRQRSASFWRPSRRRVGLRQPEYEALVERALNRADLIGFQGGRRVPKGKAR